MDALYTQVQSHWKLSLRSVEFKTFDEELEEK